MCKTKMAADASEPQPISSRTQRTRPSHSPRTHSSSRDQIPPIPSTSNPTSEVYASSSSNTKATLSGTGTSISSRTSLSSLRESISESPHIYHISEIRAATNNFLAKRYSSSSSSASTAACWRCNLRGSDTVVFQRKFRRKIQTSELRERLPVICRSHHMSIIKLLGASISGDHIYLVYEFIEGSNLSECLRNPRNPSFTVLSTWFSRMQIVTDLAHGLDYVHNQTGLNLSIVHNHIKSSSIIVTEASFRAKLCHFGTAQLCGETEEDKAPEIDTSKMRETEIEEVTEEGNDAIFSKSKRSDSGERQFEGVRGYMSPEFRSSGVATQKSDIYAFGVVILELFSGEEPFKYRYDKNTGNFLRTSVIDTAAEAVANGSEGLRRWIDKRLNDSFPVEVAEKLMRLALDCVHVDPDKRPDMGRVAGKISKLYLESKTWTDNVKVPTGISVSWAPR